MIPLSHFVRTTLNPAMYHGHFKEPPFFEGWYFKLVNAPETQRFAIIPGVFLGENAHAFIQILDGNTAQSRYHRFESSDFWASTERFEVHIGKNVFTADSLEIDIDDHLGQVSGELKFEGGTPWPVSITSPGIMGWYAWVPKMECYHGVLSFDHKIHGSLMINEQSIGFTNGRGYLEKDWGESFPAGYTWFQSNHFETPGTSLTASIAVIPWLGKAFRGFIVGLWYKNHLYRFATYSGARTEAFSIADDRVTWTLRDRHRRLELVAFRAEGGLLHEPTRSEMLQRVEETMLATVEVKLTTLAGDTIFAGQGRNASLEVNGDIPRLLAMK
jgi:tocopherol cyclase